MRLRARLWYIAISTFCIASLTAAGLGATVPGSKKPPATPETVRLLGLESLKGISKSDRAAIFEEYVGAFRAAASDRNEARQRELAEHATQLFPELRRPWCHLAAARLRIQQWGPAIEAARRAETARDDPFSPPILPDESAAGAAYWEGWAMYRTQRFDEALPKLRLARTRAPRWPEAARALGEAAFVAGRAPEAAEAYGAAFELDPMVGTALDLAYCAEARAGGGNLEGGVVALQEAIRRAPFEPGLHAKLGDLFRREGQLTEAWYELVLEGLLHGPQGRFTQPAVNMAQALVDTVRVQEKNPHRHELLLVSSGLASLDAGEPHAAVHQLQHLVQVTRSASPVPRFLLADALHRDEQDTPSRTVLEEILATNSEFAPALQLLSDVQTKLGHPREAETALQRARDLFPGYWKLQGKNGRS